ncbi:hypothetical protein [Limnohabitans sp.]
MKIPAQPYRCALGKVQPVVTDLDAVKRSGSVGIAISCVRCDVEH